MIAYEVQQNFIKDIEWIAKTKNMVLEREERNSKREAERQERLVARQRM